MIKVMTRMMSVTEIVLKLISTMSVVVLTVVCRHQRVLWNGMMSGIVSITMVRALTQVMKKTVSITIVAIC